MSRKHWPREGGLSLDLGTGVGGGGYKIYINDLFTTDDSNPIVTPRSAEPGPGTLVTTDSGGHVSISGGYLIFDGNAGNADPLCVYSNAISRGVGKAVLSKFTPLTELTNGCYWGFANSATPAYSNFAHLGLRIDVSAAGTINGYDGSAAYPIGNIAVGYEYDIGVVLQNPGVCFIIKGGSYESEYYTFLYYYQTGTAATVYAVPNFSYGTKHKQRQFKVRDLISNFKQDQGPYISWTAVVSADTEKYAPLDGFITYKWTPGAGDTLELSWRYTDDNNRMLLRCSQADGNLKIYAKKGGVETQYGSTATQTFTAGSPYIINIAYESQIIKTWVNNGYKCNTVAAVYNNGSRLVKANLAGANLGIYPRFMDINGNVRHKMYASRAAAYLTTPTADATGQAVHPDVIFIPGGWNGYEYWMTMTGYFHADASTEEPHILASNDKTTWEVPAGLTNPLYTILGIDQTSDSDLILDQNNVLWCIWRETNGVDTDTIRAKYSSDGVTWSALQTLFAAGKNEALSPAIIWDGTQYVIYSVNDITHNLERKTSATLPGAWSAATVLTTNIPGGTLWHIDVIKDGGIYYALYCGKTPNYSLGLGKSSDGVTWIFETPFMSQGMAGLWDKGVYRGSIIKTLTGFDMWYSANDEATPQNWYIGYTTIQE